MVDRPDVEAPRGVELTGTNGREAITLPIADGAWGSRRLFPFDREHDGHGTILEAAHASTVRFPDHHGPSHARAWGDS